MSCDEFRRSTCVKSYAYCFTLLFKLKHSVSSSSESQSAPSHPPALPVLTSIIHLPIKGSSIMIQLPDIRSAAVQCQFCLRRFFAPTETMQINTLPLDTMYRLPWSPSYTSFQPPAWSICCTQSWGYMKGVLQPRQKRLPAGLAIYLPICSMSGCL